MKTMRFGGDSASDRTFLSSTLYLVDTQELLTQLSHPKEKTTRSMDPFSAEGGKLLIQCCDRVRLRADQQPELLNMQNAFHQGQYQNVIDFDTGSLSPENSLPGRVLQLRAQIADRQVEDVIAQVEGEDQVPDLAAVKALAQHALGDTSGALKEVEQLVSTSPENQTVQVLAATVLQAEGRSEDALNLLAKHQGNLEA